MNAGHTGKRVALQNIQGAANGQGMGEAGSGGDKLFPKGQYAP